MNTGKWHYLNPSDLIVSSTLLSLSFSDFRPFSYLYSKLRRKIWKAATAYPEAKPNICIFPKDFN
jgi:hypothetical protein